jgi:hypothetical protein
MLEKISAFWNLFRQGEAVANPAAWLKGQITVGVLSGFLMAIVAVLKAYGYDVPVTQETANTIAAGILAFASVVLPFFVHKNVGILPPVRPSDPPSAPSDSGNGA